MRPAQLTAYTAAEGVLPTAARHPWVSEGAAGVLSEGRVRLTSTGAGALYRRTLTGPSAVDRLEIQAEFQLSSDEPAWGGAGNAIWIDDGERAVGVAIGALVSFVDPQTGDILVTLPEQPGGATTRRTYHLIKLGRARWELWVDGGIVFEWPYEAGALRNSVESASIPDTSFGFGYADVVGTGSGWWERVETAVNDVLVPHPKFDRVRLDAPVALQEVWDGTPYHGKHTALYRGILGVAHATQDRMRRLAVDATADTIVVDHASFDGSLLPTAEGWTIVGDGAVSVVRQRVRIAASATNTYAKWDVTNPAVLGLDERRSWIYGARATFTVRDFAPTTWPNNVGPFLQINDIDQGFVAKMVVDANNPKLFGFVLNDGAPLALHSVDLERSHVVELFVVGNNSAGNAYVLLFVDDELVDEQPYGQVAGDDSGCSVYVGRYGSATQQATVDIEDVFAYVAHADLSYRTLLQRRVAERLVFASGCERNDRLEVWLRHRAGVFQARGTDRLVYELRRLACDDDAALLMDRTPTDWYVGITYPELTPIFIGGNGYVFGAAAEFAVDDAPNFTATQLRALVQRYLLPHSTREARFAAYPVARISAAGAGGGGTEITVNGVVGFAVGDDVQVRNSTTGTMLQVTYDADESLVDLLSSQVRDFSGADRTGTISGANAAVGNDTAMSAVLIPTSSAVGEGIRSGSVNPSIATGFTYAGRFTVGTTHSADWWIAKSVAGVGTGGFAIWWDNSPAQITAEVYDGASTKSVSYSYNPSTNTTFHVGVRWNDTTNVLSIWINGALVASSASTAFTMLNPGSNPLGFGCHETLGTQNWLGRHSDHSLYTRTLSDAEMLTLYNDATGRISLRRDASLFVAYLMRGYGAIRATHDDAVPPSAADIMTIGVAGGRPSAAWQVSSIGECGGEIGGSISLSGLDSHRAAAITANNAVRVVGASGVVDVWVEVYGIAQGSGLPTMERVRAVGTNPVTTTTLWATVHGAVTDKNAQANVLVQDTSGPTTLYTIATGTRSRGVHLFDAPLLGGPSTLSVVADGASSADVLVFGVEEGDNYTGEKVTLNGTTPVGMLVTFASVRVVAMGYVAAARLVTVTGQLVDPDGIIVGVSDSASDTQTATVFIVSTSGEARAVDLVLDGTTPASVPVGFGSGLLWRVLGVRLSQAAVGTVTLTLDSGAPSDVLVATLGAGEISAGMDLRRIANDGDLRVAISAVATTPRWVGVYGARADGSRDFRVVRPTSTAAVSVSDEIREFLGVAVGHVPVAHHLTVSGTAWRYTHAVEALQQVGLLRGWTVAGPSSGELPGDGVLDALVATDATLATVSLTGTWSSPVETATVLAAAGTTLTVSTLSGSYGSGDVVRLV